MRAALLALLLCSCAAMTPLSPPPTPTPAAYDSQIFIRAQIDDNRSTADKGALSVALGVIGLCVEALIKLLT